MNGKFYRYGKHKNKTSIIKEKLEIELKGQYKRLVHLRLMISDEISSFRFYKTRFGSWIVVLKYSIADAIFQIQRIEKELKNV